MYGTNSTDENCSRRSLRAANIQYLDIRGTRDFGTADVEAADWPSATAGGPAVPDGRAGQSRAEGAALCVGARLRVALCVCARTRARVCVLATTSGLFQLEGLRVAPGRQLVHELTHTMSERRGGPVDLYSVGGQRDF